MKTEFPQLAYSEQTCLPNDTFQHCTLVCSSGNAQLGCLSVPNCTDAEVSLFVHCMASEGAARCFTVPPTPSQAPFPCDVAEKYHSAGT